ncbi:MAG: metalloregulator ArsR/SmtB family transcription factor [Phycisphaerae bacterium]
MLRLLGDPTRLKLMLLLDKEEINVSDLCRKTRLPQPTVSHHLGILRSGGLVMNRRAGKEVYYRQHGAGKAPLKAVLRLGPLMIGPARGK